jgi:OsmC-like protein
VSLGGWIDEFGDKPSIAPCCKAMISARHWCASCRQRDVIYTEEVPMIRKANAIWRGTGRDGTGDLSTDSGVLASTPYSFKTRFENEKGTNPEELIAAAHAGCFTMALAFGLQSAGFTPTELSTEAAVTLEPVGRGFRISQL